VQQLLLLRHSPDGFAVAANRAKRAVGVLFRFGTKFRDVEPFETQEPNLLRPGTN